MVGRWLSVLKEGVVGLGGQVLFPSVYCCRAVLQFQSIHLLHAPSKPHDCRPHTPMKQVPHLVGVNHASRAHAQVQQQGRSYSTRQFSRRREWKLSYSNGSVGLSGHILVAKQAALYRPNRAAGQW